VKTWQVVLTSAPEVPVGEVRFTPGAEPEVGSTEFAALSPAGEGWLLIVSEFVRGEQDCHVFIEGALRQGPHDRDLRQLEGALRLIPQNFPVLGILGLRDAPLEGQAELEDPAVEAVKTLLRERSVAALQGVPGASSEALLDMLRRVTRASSEGALAAALEFLLNELRGAGAETLAVWDLALRELRRDAEDPAISSTLKAFVREYTRFRVAKPPIVH